MYRCFLAGDRAGAVKLAEEILARRPDDILAATLVAHCTSPPEIDAMVAMNDTPELLVPVGGMSSAELGPLAAFLLPCIDGSTTVAEIVDGAAEIGTVEAVLGALEALASKGVIRPRKA